MLAMLFCFAMITPVTCLEEPEAISFTGSGDDVTSSFELDEGIAIFHMTHDGDSNFAIWLYNEDTGEREDLLVNEIGSYSGKTIVGVTTDWGDVEPGSFLLDVDADGKWKITITQPRPSSAPGLPQTFDGKGSDVPSPFSVESGKGAIKFHMTHDGDSNFAIWLYHVDGDREELLVNEIGEYDGSSLESVGAGIYYLDIEADGKWEVEVSYASEPEPTPEPTPEPEPTPSPEETPEEETGSCFGTILIAVIPIVGIIGLVSKKRNKK